MAWDIDSLQSLLSQESDWTVAREGDSVCITNEDGIDACLSVSGAQIVAETVLFPASKVSDPSALNAHVLETHVIFPLTTVGISTINGEKYYTAFGSLSSDSKKESVEREVALLFQNVGDMLEAYREYLG